MTQLTDENIVSRILTIKAWGRDEQQLTPFDKVKVSTIAGSTTGALSGALSMTQPSILLNFCIEPPN